MNERKLRDSLRESEIQRIKLRKLRQTECGHRKSQLSIPSYEFAFHLLKLPTGEIVGVCPYCQKMISSIDPSDAEIFNCVSKSGMAESIQFLPDDDDKLFKQLSRYTPEEKDRVLKETISDLRKKKSDSDSRCEVKYQPYPTEQEMREMPIENLKILAEEYVTKTFPKKRKK